VIDTEGGCGFGDTIGRLYVMDADGSNMRALFDEPRVIGHLRWGPDSARLAYVTHTGEAMRASDSIDIIVIDAADGAELQRWPGLEPAWTPDGAQIIFFRAQPDDPNFVDLYAYDLLDGTERALDARPGNIEQFDIAPDSATIAYTYYEIINNVRQGGLFAVDLADGEPRSLTEEQDGHALVYSPDGTMIAFEGLEGGFYLMNADGSDLRAVTTSETQGFRAAAPIWSPDGTMFAFDLPSTAPDLEYRPYTLHVYDVSAETVTNLSPGILTESGHQWSPNSDQIIFMGKQPEGGADLYSVRVNDSNAPRNLTESADRFEMTPDWQPDGDD
jgi:Tol biopolymer transport system component